MKSSTTSVQIVGVLAVAGPALSAAGELPRYEIRWVAPPETAGIGKLNDHGQVVGTRRTGDGGLIPFVWSGGVVTDLPRLPGWSRAAPSAINNHGEIVGSVFDDGKGTRPVRWRNGQIIELTASNPNAYVHDINDAGVAVGTSWTDPVGPYESVVWADTAGVSLPPVDGEIASAAWCINNRGQILGGLGPRAFPVAIWTDGSGQRLQPPGLSIVSFAGVGLNNAGDAVAGYWFGDGPTDGVWRALLFRSGTVTDIGSLGPPSIVFPTSPTGINDDGIVVGRSDGRAFIWKDGVMTDFATLVDGAEGFEFLFLRSINNHGWVVASVAIDGIQREVLLSPVPAPGTAAVVALGVLTLARRRR
jgi:probable HAF family extracellular repeat protein